MSDFTHILVRLFKSIIYFFTPNSLWRLVCIGILLNSHHARAQNVHIKGRVHLNPDEKIKYGVVLLKNTPYKTELLHDGTFKIPNVPIGNYTVLAFSLGKRAEEKPITVAQDVFLDLALKDLGSELDDITIQAERTYTLGITQLKSVENFGIYEGKKTEVVNLDDIYANTSTNNARQIYGRITGLNIWESDQAGLQLGIGGRGLSPNRTANFNVRQNGYDISADALGYPESYYTPPTEALERIEIVRGAASLQYGTQFGGMLNFRFKTPNPFKNLEYTGRQSVGSWGFFNSFHSLSGTVNKVSYYTFYQFRRADGYRANSGFFSHNGFFSINYHATPKLTLNVEYTKLYYVAQQPGGLTDRAFQTNPRQSLRNRNWFNVDWNLAAITATYKFTPQTQLNIRNFGLLAQRLALGNLERINVADFGRERTMIDGTFANAGNETRLLHNYSFLGLSHAFLAGVRLYKGNTSARQGLASAASDADFRFLNPSNLENSDFNFPSTNVAFFAENMFHVHPKITITPGVRWEHIRTQANGYYNMNVFDGAGNLLAQRRMNENTQRMRSFILAGLGVSYKPVSGAELYANLSQNYRAINFSDLRINNPNLRIDPNIKDESGYTADIGIRGKKGNIFTYEITYFYLYYKGKIGQVLRTDTVLFNDYRWRSNISDARNTGVEAFAEVDFVNWIYPNSKLSGRLFTNFSYIDARYLGTLDNSKRNKKVEMVPPVMLRVGNTWIYKRLGATLQYAYTAQHFSDASNAIRTASAVEGIIPAYSVADVSVYYMWKNFRIEGSVNNLFNESYFTRRAEGYPGPGIIPADGRGFYLTLNGVF